MTNKPVWILLRGLAREAGHWGPFVGDFARELGVETACLDLPGAGVHCRIPAPTTIKATMEFVRAEFLELGLVGGAQTELARPVFLLAFSLGAMVGIEWLHQHPADFRGAVFINTSLRGLSPAYKRLWPEAYPRLWRILLAKDEVARERVVLEMVSNKPSIREQTALIWGDILRRHPITSENFIRQLVAAARYHPPAQTPQLPVLLLNSLGDQMVHPSCSEALQKHWRTALERHPTAGHDLVLDEPEWVIAQINAWQKSQLAV